jgi:hypothetical protein
MLLNQFDEKDAQSAVDEAEFLFDFLNEVLKDR